MGRLSSIRGAAGWARKDCAGDCVQFAAGAVASRAGQRYVELTPFVASVPAPRCLQMKKNQCMNAEELKETACRSGAGLPKRVASVHREQGVPVVPTWPSKRYMPPNARIPTQKCRMRLTELIDYELRTDRLVSYFLQVS